jgi:hypothetical protein
MLVALILASGILSTVDVGARSEMRMRVAPSVVSTSTGTKTGDVSVGADLLVTPYARYQARTRHVDFKLGYAALVTVPDIEQIFTGQPRTPELFQMADTSAFYSSKHWVVGASEAGAFGQMNFSYLTPYPVTPSGPVSSGPPPLQLVPCTDALHCQNITVNFGASATSFAMRWTGRHSSFSIAPAYSISGGTDRNSQQTVPLVSMPRVDAAFEHQTSRRDYFVTEAEATAANSSIRACNKDNGGPAPMIPDKTDPTKLVPDPFPSACAPAEQWVALREVWRRRITRRITSEVGLGAMVASVSYNRAEVSTFNVDDKGASKDTQLQPFNVFPYPLARVMFAYTLQNSDPDRPLLHRVLTDPPKPSIYTYARVGPVVDTHYGFFDPRFEVGVAALHAIDAKYTVQAHLGFLRSLPPTLLNATYFGGDVQVTRRLDMYRFELGGGLRGAYQHDIFSGEFYVFSAYIVLLWHEPRFVL